MSRSLLKAGIIFTLILVLDGLIYSYYYYQTEGQIWMDIAFRKWLIIGYSLGFIVTILLAIYFKSKNYRVLFIITIIEIPITIFRFINDYQAVGSEEIGLLFHTSVIAIQLIGLAFAIALISTIAREQRYLRLVGQVLCVFIPIVLTLYILYWTSSSADIKVTIGNIFLWLEPAGQFIPIFYALNFMDELKKLPKNQMQVA
ncbi:hypothetical protein [Ekhidna sp.]